MWEISVGQIHLRTEIIAILQNYRFGPFFAYSGGILNAKKVNAANIEDKIRNEHFCSEIAVSHER